MKNHLYHSLIALFGGLFGASVLFIVFHLLIGLESPFSPTPLGIFLHYLILVSLIEEGTKFLLIKRGVGQHPYGFFLGLGFGLAEGWFKFPPWELGFLYESHIGAVMLHIITAGLIAYFIRAKRPVLGLVIAIVLHTGFNLLVN